MRTMNKIKDNWCEHCGSSKLACSKCKLNAPSNWTAKKSSANAIPDEDEDDIIEGVL